MPVEKNIEREGNKSEPEIWHKVDLKRGAATYPHRK